MKREINVHSLFPTYCVATQWVGPDVDVLNQMLSEQLWKKRALDPDGVYRSNAAGCWHSKDDVLTTTKEAGKLLGQMFFKAFGSMGDLLGGQPGGQYNMSLAAWAMLMNDRGYSTCHTHPNCHFSGVYYATGPGEGPKKTMATGVRIQPGTIEFVDTRGGQGCQQVQGLNMNPAGRIVPKAGLMLVFPAGLPHFVHPVEGEGDRISIACNASIKQYTPPTPEATEATEATEAIKEAKAKAAEEKAASEKPAPKSRSKKESK